MRPRYGFSLKRTGASFSSSEANTTGALELNIGPPLAPEATTSRDGRLGRDDVNLTAPPERAGSDACARSCFAAGESVLILGPPTVASNPSDSNRARNSSASSRERFDPTTTAHVLV